ncbi:hypothetical protein BO82DRAFT_355449 [Aspergillus uvarum CBS 121591]|uniref:Uncharacterized protein n=1 Tax=Aspergillus uvarum CBS 121591 TaxID=1448315 RepID=A0A319C942_9EURO|nr:hypothetical protein BO82DRAFT_355449 [Aspergillus uvarum CBS 121591]PYH80479.1 hypothetical protein BO82DRAFT_355449 [Aspergillus uvarum CBS 121591]
MDGYTTSDTSQQRPYYSHLIQLHKDNGAGDWHRWLVVAATRSDMITFFKGLQKYAKRSDANITEVEPVNLAWWTFSAREGYNVRELICQIYRLNPTWYGNIHELNDSRGKICVTLQDDAGGRRWPVLPPQDTSIDGIFVRDDNV